MHAFESRSSTPSVWAGATLHQKCSACGAPKGAGPCSKCGDADDKSAASRGRVQAKLRISEPGDAHEREADRVADAVVAGAMVSGALGSAPMLPGVSRSADGDDLGTDDAEDEFDPASESDEDVEDVEGDVMRQATGVANASADLSATIPAGRGSGLEPEVRSTMEQRFGHDFSDVRVHTDGDAAVSAHQIDARAYTYGADIYFGSGNYRPTDTEGQRLLAHELTHVVQQRAGAEGIFRKPAAKAVKKKKSGGGAKRIVVILDDQKAMAMEGDKVVKTMDISSGKKGHRTTTSGTSDFSISEKDPDHRSSTYGHCGTREVDNGAADCKKGETYSGAPMTNFLRFNGAEGFHQGVLPGHAASHGCVRLSAKNAKWLFDWASKGTPVAVKQSTPKNAAAPKKKTAPKKASAPKKAAPANKRKRK